MDVRKLKTAFCQGVVVSLAGHLKNAHRWLNIFNKMDSIAITALAFEAYEWC